ncbi:hypothetical protein BDV96DRAFT_581226 [Lophiotrema nucula]|uniref:Uncharacterized protein n=1 Tax=Lophiotrema nucula TaxID=690887 RepID=A0A6A5Z164_9PLEO|nr:hypothetical protein BDV96DRAFT_581226 [Lophiotrema nucula]
MAFARPCFSFMSVMAQALSVQPKDGAVGALRKGYTSLNVCSSSTLSWYSSRVESFEQLKQFKSHISSIQLSFILFSHFLHDSGRHPYMNRQRHHLFCLFPSRLCHSPLLWAGIGSLSTPSSHLCPDSYHPNEA